MLRRDWRQTLGNSFLAIGLLLLAGVGGAWGWQQWQGLAFRDRLRAERVPPMRALPIAEAAPAATSPAGPSSGPTATPAVLRPGVVVPSREMAAPPTAASRALARPLAPPAAAPAQVRGPAGRLTAGSTTQFGLASGAKDPEPVVPAATAALKPAQTPAVVPLMPTQAPAVVPLMPTQAPTAVPLTPTQAPPAVPLSRRRHQYPRPPQRLPRSRCAW